MESFGRDLGEAFIRPGGSFRAGEGGSWTVTYVSGRFGMDDGGSILVAQRDMSDGGFLQCTSPGEPGYVSASTDGNAHVEVKYDPWRWVRPWRGALIARVFDGSLAPGERIDLVLGDRSAGCPGWELQTFPETTHEFRVLADPFGTRLYRSISAHPSIRIVPGKPASLDAILPTTVEPGQEVPLRVRVMDFWGNPLQEFSGEIEVVCDPPIDPPPGSVRIEGGVAPAGTLAFSEPGLFRIRLIHGDLSGVSNPVLVSKGAPHVFWADLHGQTQDAIGTGTVEEYFSYARDSALVDACSWQGNDFQVTDESWGEVCRRTREFNEPGRFVTFLGFEWSGPTPLGGDHNIMYLEDDRPIRRSSLWQIPEQRAEDYSPISRLWEELGGEEAMAVAHVGGRHANLDHWDPGVCGLIEVYSCHGTFEWLVGDALRRGYTFGIVAGSDDHTGRPGWSPPLRRGGVRGTVRLDMFGGLTGIYAEELTRQGLWEALRARHCYATTGRRMGLDVRSGKYMMGDIVQGDGPIELSVAVVGTSPLLDVQVFRDDGVVHDQPVPADRDGDWIRVTWSGLRVRSRNRRARWNSELSVPGGQIKEIVPFGFWRRGDSAERGSPGEVTIKSTTSGDSVGVFLRVSPGAEKIRYRSAEMVKEVDISNLKESPSTFDAGGLNRTLVFSTSSPRGRPESFRFDFREKSPGRPSAYWVRAMQMDGNCAWSSPIYFRASP